MHAGFAGALQPSAEPCPTCGAPVRSKKKWARFCGNACRNAFHVAEGRKEAIRAKALELYAALVNIAGETGTPYGRVAAEALKGLRPPVEPKELLKP